VNRIRCLLIALLMLALPVQGAVASSRWLCAAMAPASSGTATMHSRHATHVHAVNVAHATPAHAHSAAAHDSAAAPLHHAAASDETSAMSQETGCNLCAACSVTAAAPPASLVLAAIDATGAQFPALAVPVPRVVADGLERPPRTV